MPNQDDLSPGERELEAALAGLHAAAPSINRDELMFRAGQRSARRRTRAWQTAAVCLGLSTGLAILYPPAPREVPRTVYVSIPPAPSPGWPVPGPVQANPAATELAGTGSSPIRLGNPLPPDGYLRVRNAVLARGLDALPSLSFASHRGSDESPLTEESLRRRSPSHWGL